MIRALLWDVDGTLLDFQAAERAAIMSLFSEFGLGPCSEAMVRRYSAINDGFWKRLERGEITKPQVLVGRFEVFFAECGLDVSLAPVFNARYQLALGDTIVFRDDALNLVREADSLRPGRADGRHFPVRGSWGGEAQLPFF